MRHIFIFLLLITVLTPSSFQEYLNDNGLDIRIKSKPGWMRIINSPEKRKEYNLKLENKDIQKFTTELKEMYKKEKEGGLL